MDKTVWTYSIGDLSIEKRKNSSPLHLFTYRLPAEVSFLRYSKNHFYEKSLSMVLIYFARLRYSRNSREKANTECPKMYRKSVLHLLKYRFA